VTALRPHRRRPLPCHVTARRLDGRS
jgi:hypothetical protein